MIGYVNQIETLGTLDGPGIRIVVFLEGCPLRCIYCHNPEMWEMKEKNKITKNELVKKIKRYKQYLKHGGVTFSGGEPLMQSDFLLEVAKELKEEGIHLCLDTSGEGKNYKDLLEYIDLVILDIKATNPEQFIDMTLREINYSQTFLEYLNHINKDTWIRQVIIPGINDSKEKILELKNLCKGYSNIKKIELLPYHRMGLEKYKSLGIPYKIEQIKDMNINHLIELEQFLH